MQVSRPEGSACGRRPWFSLTPYSFRRTSLRVSRREKREESNCVLEKMQAVENGHGMRCEKQVVTLGRFELPTCGLGNRRSIHLSYRAIGRNQFYWLSLLQPKCRACASAASGGPLGESASCSIPAWRRRRRMKTQCGAEKLTSARIHTHLPSSCPRISE